MSYRDLMCGDPRLARAGEVLTMSGWVGRRRDHGGLIFIDLRDRTGSTQLVLDPEHAPAAHAAAHELRLESVVKARGSLVPRSEATRNAQLATGDVELLVDELELLAGAEVLPFQLDDENVDEALRITHRYLDLRRPRMQELQEIRLRAVRSIRSFLDARGFLLGAQGHRDGKKRGEQTEDVWFHGWKRVGRTTEARCRSIIIRRELKIRSRGRQSAG